MAHPHKTTTTALVELAQTILSTYLDYSAKKNLRWNNSSRKVGLKLILVILLLAAFITCMLASLLIILSYILLDFGFQWYSVSCYILLISGLGIIGSVILALYFAKNL